MMSSMRFVALVLAVVGTSESATLKATMATASRANPMRRVVTMLQMMQKKVEAEGKKAEELFDKFMCYCNNADETLGASIKEAEEKIPQLESSIKEQVEEHKLLGEQLEKHKADRADAKEEIAKATALRQKENEAFLKESSSSQSNLDALGKAIPAIEKGMSGGFLQTNTAQILQKLSLTQDLSAPDRDMLSAFLSQGQGDSAGYAPASGEIVGILKQMKDDMEKDLKEITAEEDAAAADFQALVDAKKKQIDADTKAIEEKTAREGELAVEIVTVKNDLEDTKEQLAEDKKFLAELDKTCALKKKEWEAYQKMHAEELIALADVIKMLNDDDALDLFKKTLPSAAASAFIQVDDAVEIRKQALQAIHGGGRGMSLDFIALALRGKKQGFEKVIKLIDDMTVLLGKEQKEDDSKKEYCLAEFDKSEDQKKVFELDASDIQKAITEGEDAMETLTEDIDGLKKGIADLDKSVVEATEQRKEEHTEASENIASNGAAKQLIEMAKNRLNKFYNPKLYKPPPKRELTEEERITLNMGGTLAPTAPPGGIAGTGIGLTQNGAAPPPPPAADLSYKKKGEESGGVIAMMDSLKAELETEIQQMEMEEKDAQEDYEIMMKDASEKRSTDSKAITEKEDAKAELEASLQKSKDEKKAKDEEIMAIKQYISTLHADCDWLLENYDARKEARTNEIDAMKKAKAVLSGADSLLQTRVTRKLRRA